MNHAEEEDTNFTIFACSSFSNLKERLSYERTEPNKMVNRSTLNFICRNDQTLVKSDADSFSAFSSEKELTQISFELAHESIRYHRVGCF